ncbi:MAG: phosphate acyltransferase PlsX [Cytophagales bacterium]
MKIGVDVMGGDLAPDEILTGAILASKEISSETKIVLIGKQEAITESLTKQGLTSSAFEIINAEEVIGMNEHPTKAVSSKPNSSIMKGFKALAMKQIDVFSSAGNTGAMMVGAMFTIKPVEKIMRPAIAGFIPKVNNKYGVLLDVGANAECKPEVLQQFAELGSLFYQHVFNAPNVRVGLLSLGEEEEKGTQTIQQAHQLLKNNPKINFIGNVEGRDIFLDKADVIVCDGYAGNVVLKMAESIYPILTEKGFKDPFLDLFNWKNVGGSPILGVNGNVIIGHGSSDAHAIKNMILQSEIMANSNITQKIIEAYA